MRAAMCKPDRPIRSSRSISAPAQISEKLVPEYMCCVRLSFSLSFALCVCVCVWVGGCNIYITLLYISEKLLPEYMCYI